MRLPMVTSTSTKRHLHRTPVRKADDFAMTYICLMFLGLTELRLHGGWFYSPFLSNTVVWVFVKTLAKH